MLYNPHLNSTSLLRFLYFLLVLITGLVSLVSTVFILSQAVRTAPNKDWTKNVNAIVIGAAYIVVLAFSLAFCLNRRLSVRLKLARIPKGRIAIGKGDLPKVVHNFIEGEFLRSCAIVAACQPKVLHREGWGTPGTKYEGIRFRTAILDTVGPIDKATRAVIPSLPPLSPHVSLARHLRHILPLLSLPDAHSENFDIDSKHESVDAIGDVVTSSAEALFQFYTAAVEKARYAECEMSEAEFDGALQAAGILKGILDAYKVALDEQR